MTTRLSEHDFLQDLLIFENTRIDPDQQQLITRLRHHVRMLWRHVQRLESVISGTQEELMLKVGNASLVLKKDGTIIIDGKDVTIRASGRAEIKSNNTLTLKGSRILQN